MITNVSNDVIRGTVLSYLRTNSKDRKMADIGADVFVLEYVNFGKQELVVFRTNNSHIVNASMQVIAEYGTQFLAFRPDGTELTETEIREIGDFTEIDRVLAEARKGETGSQPESAPATEPTNSEETSEQSQAGQ